MFSPRYKRISESDVLVARRITFFERPRKSNSGPLDQVDPCKKTGSGRERALGPRSTQSMRFAALTTSHLAFESFQVTTAMIGTARMLPSVARSGLLVSVGSSGKGSVELPSNFRPTRSGFLLSGPLAPAWGQAPTLRRHAGRKTRMTLCISSVSGRWSGKINVPTQEHGNETGNNSARTWFPKHARQQ